MTDLAPIQKRIRRYLLKHRRLSPSQIYSWIASVRKDGGYTLQQFEAALTEMRDAGEVVCTSGAWYLYPHRQQVRKSEPPRAQAKAVAE